MATAQPPHPPAPPRRIPWELLAVAFVSLVGLALLFVLARAGWPGRASACLDRFICYCERPVRGLVRQPGNTWSNLASFPAALWIARDAGRVRRTHAVVANLGAVLALALAAEGLGSMAFHGSLTVWGAVADAVAMFLVLGFLLLLALVRHGVAVRAAAAVYVGLLAVALMYRLLVAPVMAPLFLAVVVAILLLERRLVLARAEPLRSRALLAALATFGAAAAAWALALMPGYPLCYPDSALHGHALWHLGVAVACVFLWLHTRDELTRAAER